MALSAYHGNTAVQLRPCTVVTADTTSTAVNVAKYEGIAMALLTAGAGTSDTDASRSAVVTLYDADTTSDTFATTGYVFTTRVTTAGVEGIMVDLANCKTFLKVVTDVTGTNISYAGIGVTLIAPGSGR